MGKGPSLPPPPPLSEQVTYRQDTGYTDWGDGYRKDDNKHFSYQGQDYYVTPGQDINDRSNWQPDTMAGHHITAGQKELLDIQQQEIEMFNQINASIERAMAAASASNRSIADAINRQNAARSSEAASIDEANKKRLALAAKGRMGTWLTRGKEEEEAPVKKASLLGA